MFKTLCLGIQRREDPNEAFCVLAPTWSDVGLVEMD